jgi:hypothetical protein
MARLLSMIVLMLAAGGAWSAPWESLVMPGEVIQGHAKYEQKCESCHSKFDKHNQNPLCRDCHKDVNTDMQAGHGYHGKMINAQSVQCVTCHTDHKGRNANIVALDKETFDHARTDFALKEGHARTQCASCHKSGKRWRDAPSDCFSCHQKDDKHQEKLGKECNTCHGTETWRKAKFDHQKTKFPLEGAHGKVLCAACHPGEKYKETPKECAACHKIDDVHAGRYGTKCATCHTSVEWKKPRFDHEKTKFPLRDKHVDVACDSCHTGDLYKEKAPLTCNGCHKNDDVHRGKNGVKCESCHDQKGWNSNRFDHNAKSAFPLVGGHAKLQCESCHKGDIYKVKLDMACYSCHKGDDKHRGELGKQCESCHNQKSWSQRIRFDHDLTQFPLIGLHAAAPCEACHVSGADYKGTASSCVRCHADDDKHKKTLGEQCADCHTPNAWAVWKFNHDKQTKLKLTGKHAGLQCVACHRTPMGKKVEQSASCSACHRKDDVHMGRFGAACERCHTTETFKDIRLRY